MSSKFWRTEKRIEPFRCGKTTTQRVKEYEATWENRCYSEGIPDEAPEKLSKQLKVPSYKAVAMAILRNDLQLISLGFRPKETAWFEVLHKENKEKESGQMRLI